MGGFLTQMDGMDKSIEVAEDGRRQVVRQGGRQIPLMELLKWWQ